MIITMVYYTVLEIQKCSLFNDICFILIIKLINLKLLSHLYFFKHWYFSYYPCYGPVLSFKVLPEGSVSHIFHLGPFLFYVKKKKKKKKGNILSFFNGKTSTFHKK